MYKEVAFGALHSANSFTVTRTEIESAMGFCRAISHDVVPALRNSITEMVTLQQKILKKSGGLLATLEVYFER